MAEHNGFDHFDEQEQIRKLRRAVFYGFLFSAIILSIMFLGIFLFKKKSPHTPLIRNNLRKRHVVVVLGDVDNSVFRYVC